MGEYYGAWSRDQLLKINGGLQQDVDLEKLFIDLYQDKRWLDRLLEQFPEADEDGVGKITAEQAVKWHALRVPLVVPSSPMLAWLPDFGSTSFAPYPPHHCTWHEYNLRH